MVRGQKVRLGCPFKHGNRGGLSVLRGDQGQTLRIVPLCWFTFPRPWLLMMWVFSYIFWLFGFLLLRRACSSLVHFCIIFPYFLIDSREVFHCLTGVSWWTQLKLRHQIYPSFLHEAEHIVEFFFLWLAFPVCNPSADAPALSSGQYTLQMPDNGFQWQPRPLSRTLD